MVSLPPQLKIERKTIKVPFFPELINEKVSLEMMQIPAGVFVMGSPEDELERQDNESPQHVVTVPSFLMGKYPITQGQWQAVVRLTQKIDRDLDPDPSSFKEDFQQPGDRARRPVENVSWHEAMEFCQRLSQYTQRPYRLPSEAEWEYACRAVQLPSSSVLLNSEGMSNHSLIKEWNQIYHQPFHFGETITTDLANYRGKSDKESVWKGNYGRGVQGNYRKETTPVDYFGVANAFGLCEMHGNVWEWCLDQYHPSYKGAPTDGSAWRDKSDPWNDDNDPWNDDSHPKTRTLRILRGGSWSYSPGACRSAHRYGFYCVNRLKLIGFRVVCALQER